MAATSPGSGWTTTMTKGSDCNDNLFSADNSVCSVQTPTTPPATPPDLCDKLKKLNEDNKYKEKLAFVIAKAKTDSTKEYGYSIEKGASDYVAATNDSKGNLDFPDISKTVGVIHDHTSPRTTIGPDNFPEITEYIQMFSREDLRTFVKLLNFTDTNGIAIADVFSTLSDNTGNVYTLKYEGTYNDIKGKSIDVDALQKAYDTNFSDPDVYGGIESAFASFLELDVKIPGIVVYKTTPGAAPIKLGFTSDGVRILPSNTPCK